MALLGTGVELLRHFRRLGLLRPTNDRTYSRASRATITDLHG